MPEGEGAARCPRAWLSNLKATPTVAKRKSEF